MYFFDNVFEGIYRNMVAHGARLLLSPSFDAASWARAEHLQHVVLFRLRAAENGGWIVVAVSSGLTQIIDPSGRVHGVLPLMHPGTLIGDVDIRYGRTITIGSDG